MADLYLYLVRHGQYFGSSHSDPKLHGHLNELGKLQASLIAERLKPYPISELVCSNLIRAHQTGQIIQELGFKGKDLEQTELLRECTPCVPDDHKRLFEQTPPELIERGKQRADKAFATFFKPVKRDKHKALICHGNLIRYLICRALDIDPHFWLKLDICNCSLSVIKVSDKKTMKLMAFNDTGHLSIDQITFI